MNLLKSWERNVKRNDMELSKEAGCDLAGKCDLYETVCQTTYKCVQPDEGEHAGKHLWSKDLNIGTSSDKCDSLPFELKSYCNMSDEERCFKRPDESNVVCVFESKEKDVLLPNQTYGSKYIKISSQEASDLIPCGYSSLDNGGYKVHLSSSIEECRLNKIKNQNTKNIIDQSRTFWRIKNDQPERCFATDCSADSEHWVQIKIHAEADQIPVKADQIAQLRTRAWVLGQNFESDGNLYEFDPATETWDKDENVVLEKIFTNDGTICGINNNGEMFCKRDNKQWVNVAALDTDGNEIRLYDVSNNNLDNDTFAIDAQGRSLRLNDSNTWEDLLGPNLKHPPQKIGKHIMGKERISGKEWLRNSNTGGWIPKENWDKCRMDVQIEVMKKKLYSQQGVTLNTSQTLKSAFQDLKLKLEDNDLCANSPELCNTCLCELQGNCKYEEGNCSKRTGWFNSRQLSLNKDMIETFENKLEKLIRNNPDTVITNDPIISYEIENEVDSRCDS